MSFWDNVINQNKLDSSLITELSDLSYRSIGGKRQEPRGSKDEIVNIGTIPFEATITPDRITKEMIMEYQKNKDKPYIDPVTNTEYKYNPTGMDINIVPPAFVNDANLGKPATEADVKKYQNDLIILNRLLKTTEESLKKTRDKVVELKDKINSGAKGKAETQLKQAEKNVTKLEEDIQIFIKKIQATETNIESFKQNIQQNKDAIIVADKMNKDNIVKYKEALQLANQNRLNFLSKEPNESDADYLTRMKNIEMERYDTNLNQEKARLEQVVKLKMNLKGIMRRDEIIENVVKSFTGEQIFLINKNWAGIQQYFIDNFGFDNTNLTTNDIVDEIVQVLDKILNPPTAYEIKSETITSAPEKSIKPITIKDVSGADVATDFEAGVDDGNTFIIRNTANNKHIYFKIGQKNKNVVFYSTNLNSQGSFMAVRERAPPREETLNYLLFEFLGMDKKILDKVLMGQQNINGIYEVLEQGYKLQPITDIKIYKTQTRKIFGWGISHPEVEIPTFAKFGNLIILLNKLFYKNVLSLKTKTGHTIDGMKNTKVSDTLVEIIMRMYQDENVDNLIKNLTLTEKNLYNSILYMAGLHKKFKSSHNETLQELKERFKVCEGEILSGNNNPLVIKELKEILLKLNHLNAISINAIRKYLKQFN